MPWDMVSSELDARMRKRERDKENQRQKRRRERDNVEELKRRNVSLEQQVKILQDGSNESVRQLLETVKLLRERNQVLMKRLRRVDEFVKAWREGDDHGEVVGEVGEDGEPPRSRESSDTVHGNLPVTRHSSQPLRSSSNEEPRIGVDADLDIPPEAISLVTDDLHMDDSTTTSCSETTIVEPLSFPMFPDAVVESRHVTMAGESVQTTPAGPFLAPSRAQTGLFELIIPPGKLFQSVNLLVWERMPIYLDVPDWDPFGSVICEMRSSPEKFQMCAAEPGLLNPLLSNSLNELADAVFRFTSQMPSRGTERWPVNWMCYMFTRWIIESSEENYNRIPQIFRPTVTQLFVPHAPVLDYIIFPEVRDNLIQHGMKYCQPEVFDSLFYCCRIRDLPTFFVYDNGVRQTNPAFLERISSVDGWALLDKFWTKYPELVKGLDPLKFRISEKDPV